MNDDNMVKIIYDAKPMIRNKPAFTGSLTVESCHDFLSCITKYA